MLRIEISNSEILEKATDVLRSGGLIILPTETTYAVAVDSTNPEAVSRLLSYKKRPEGRAIPVAVANQQMAEEYVELNTNAKNFYKNFLPGPVTIISNSKHSVDQRLEAENGTLGIRIPNQRIVLDIIEKFGKPITVTAANIAGGKMPYSTEDILVNIPEKNKDLIDLIIDAGQLPKNPPSTVIDTTTTDLTILRSGRIDPNKTTLLESFSTNSEDETINAGSKLVTEFYKSDKPLLILLSGELGAGKTHLTKGIAKNLGVTNIIKSPTYNYVNEYKLSSGRLYHMDAWKIQSKEDLNALGFYDWFKPGNIIVVEWPSVIMNLDQEFFDALNYLFVEFIQTSANNRLLKIYSVN